ncbi:hypothetical protein BH10PSE5_BH10PSE5_01490 [soil metagenome]
MAITDAQAMNLLSANALLGHGGEALSDFEHNLVVEVYARFREHRRDVVITDAEWPVLTAAIEAMRAAVAAGRACAPQRARLRSIGRAA